VEPSSAGDARLRGAPKRLQLLKEAAPSVRSVAVLLSSEQIRSRGGHDALIAAAGAMNVELHDLGVTTPADLESAIYRAKVEGVDALYVWPSGFAFAFGKQIADFAIQHRLPSLYPFREGALSGGLLAYAADLKESARKGAAYIDKILNGARPNSLPVEQLSKYELLINVRTAKALGLELPASMLALADEVIE
jgi:putative tryptophan/tyrosine transport system substrate-binding protein